MVRIFILRLSVCTVFMLAADFARAAPNAGASDGSRSGLDLSLIGTFVSGSAKSADGSTIPSRTMLGGSAGLELGFAFKWIEPILFAEYEMIGQTTNPSTVSSQNAAGSGYLAGGGLQLNFGRWILAGFYDALGTYTLSKATSLGGSSAYTKATGYHALLGYRLGRSIDVGLTYFSDSYSSNTADGTTTDITSNKFILTTYGLYGAWKIF